MRLRVRLAKKVLVTESCIVNRDRKRGMTNLPAVLCLKLDDERGNRPMTSSDLLPPAPA